MMRFHFFFMGVPMIIMSFFEAVDVLPYVSQYNLLVNGNVVELSQEETEQLQQQVEKLFENSHTMPAFGVVTDEIFHEDVQNGYFVSMKFQTPIKINELPFDELVFKIGRDFHGFNLMRGNHGIFQGRCIYIDLQERTMEELYDFVEGLESVKEILQSPQLPDSTENSEQLENDDGVLESDGSQTEEVEQDETANNEDVNV